MTRTLIPKDSIKMKDLQEKHWTCEECGEIHVKCHSRKKVTETITYGLCNDCYKGDENGEK